MSEREIFKQLNGINYEDKEINEYMKFANIEDKKLSSITNDVRTNLAKEKLKEAGIYVEENILEKGEVIEKVIKGTDIEMLTGITAMNAIMPVPFMTAEGFSFNRLLFCTNKRIIVINANYFNNMQGNKIYNREDIKVIYVGRDVRKKYKFKMSLDLKRNKLTAIGLLMIRVFASVALAFVFSTVADMLIGEIKYVKSIVFVVCMIGFLYFYLTRRNLGTELLIELNDGNFYNVLIKNIDYEDMQKYFSNIKN